MEYEFLKVLILLGGGIIVGWLGRGVWDKRKAKKAGKL